MCYFCSLQWAWVVNIIVFFYRRGIWGTYKINNFQVIQLVTEIRFTPKSDSSGHVIFWHTILIQLNFN